MRTRTRRASSKNTSRKTPARASKPPLELLAQLRLQHLHVVVLGQRVDEAVLARAREARDVVEAEPLQFLRRNLASGDDESDDLLPPFRVRPTDDGALRHRRMAQQH